MGLPTRGKTASNRLRRVDNFILLYEPALLARTSAGDPFRHAFFVDLGYGFDARTTLESAARFRRVNPNLPILGVEIDKERVESALPYADSITHFRLGGFNLPLLPGETVRLIRAFNVLRQYEEKNFVPAYETLARYVLPGGLMIEGTSNPFGSLWAANLARNILTPETGRQSWKMEALVSVPTSTQDSISPISRQFYPRITSIMSCRVKQSTTSSRIGNVLRRKPWRREHLG